MQKDRIIEIVGPAIVPQDALTIGESAVKKLLTYRSSDKMDFSSVWDKEARQYRTVDNRIYAYKTLPDGRLLAPWHAIRKYIKAEYAPARRPFYEKIKGTPFSFSGVLRKHQQSWEAVLLPPLQTKGHVIGQASCGCHAKDTRIMMSDGRLKPVQDIIAGDRLMGVDGPRVVQKLHRGRQSMARIVPIKGESFEVNEGHILTLVWSVSQGEHKDGDLIDISVKDYMQLSHNTKTHLKLYRPAVSYFEGETTSFPIEPYHLGMLLGDGGLTVTTSLFTRDTEIEHEMHLLAKQFGLTISNRPKNGCAGLFPVGHMRAANGSCINPLNDTLRKLGVFGKRAEHKYVPHEYKTASYADRCALIAGLLDTDGHLSGSNCYDWISKSETLADDLVFLCRSVGLAAYKTLKRNKAQTGPVRDYWRVNISGDCTILPIRIARKKSPPRKINKRVNRVGFSIELLGEADYYGFSVDGDNRYLMGDFTLTHNSGKSFMGAYFIAKLRPLKTVVVINTDDLRRQWPAEFKQWLTGATITNSIKTYAKNPGKWDILVTTVQALMFRNERGEPPLEFDLAIFDEVDVYAAKKFSSAVMNLRWAKSLGLTATVDRPDGLSNLIYDILGPDVVALESDNMKPTVYVIPFKLPEELLEKLVDYDDRTGRRDQLKVDRFRVNQYLQECDERNEFIVKMIYGAAKHDRNIMVMSNFVLHLEYLKDRFDAEYPGHSTAFRHGKSSREELKEAETAKIIFGTIGKNKRGLNINHLDCLIQALPSRDPRQDIGRFQRRVPGKRDPVVFDIVDVNCVPLAQRARSRMKKYREIGAEIVDRTNMGF